jgi:MFS family permease
VRSDSLLRERDFALLFGGETVSELGSSVTYLVFPLIAVQTLHASALAVGLVAAAGNAAWLVVSLPAGAWIDRVRRAPVLIGTDIGSAILLATVPVAFAFHALTVAQLVVVAFGIGLLSVVFDIAYPAFLPSVIPADRLVDGNGLLEASANAARIAGPGVGGLLVQAVGAPAALLTDAVSFLVSASTIGAMRVSETDSSGTARPGGADPALEADPPVDVGARPVAGAVAAASASAAGVASGTGTVPGFGSTSEPGRSPAAGLASVPAARPKMRHEIAAGLRFVLGNATTRALTAGVTVANFVFGGYTAVVVVFLARQLGISAGVIGVLFAVGGVGGIIGSLLAGPVARRIGDARLLWVSTVVITPFTLMIPLTGRGLGMIWFLVGSLMLSLGIAAFNVCARAAIQRTAPVGMLGRVTASIRVFSRGALPVGAVVGGVLADLSTPRVGLFAVLGLYVVVPVVLVSSPLGRVRSLESLGSAVGVEAG